MTVRIYLENERKKGGGAGRWVACTHARNCSVVSKAFLQAGPVPWPVTAEAQDVPQKSLSQADSTAGSLGSGTAWPLLHACARGSIGCEGEGAPPPELIFCVLGRAH